MRCPYCQTPGHEELPRCPECGFALKQVRELFGVSPTLTAGLNDLQGIFVNRERRRLDFILAQFRRRFPQSAFSVVTLDHPNTTLPIGIVGFWLFNTTPVSRNLDKGGDNHDFLLLIDGKLGLSSLTIGYGLEPFVSEDHLRFVLEQAKPQFEEGAFAAGVEAVLGATENTLGEICSNLNQTYGIDMQRLYEDEKRKTGELIQKDEY